MPDHTPDYTALIHAAQNGDEHALNTVLTYARKIIFRIANKTLHSYAGGTEMAEDATQEAVLAIHEALPRWTYTGAPPEAFFYNIGWNKIRDAQRAWGRSKIRLGLDTTADDATRMADPALGPEELYMQQATVERVRRMLERIPDRQAKMLLMRSAGFTAPEIASVLDMTENNVRVHQFRAVARLRKHEHVDEQN